MFTSNLFLTLWFPTRGAIISCTIGKRRSTAAKSSSHPGIDVYFYRCAWAVGNFCLDWVEQTLKPAIEGRFLFCENLSGQITEEFAQKVAEIGGICWHDLTNTTDIWQPVDARHAEQLKVNIKFEQFKWLNSDENAEDRHGVNQSLTASEKSILLTEWIGKTYKNLLNNKYDGFRCSVVGHLKKTVAF